MTTTPTTAQAAVVASEFARSYVGTFGFMQDMKANVLAGKSLTERQVTGVLNCRAAELRRAAKAPQTTGGDFGQSMEPGIYVTEHAGIVKVQQNKVGTRVYALVWTGINGERLNLNDEHVKGEWIYTPGLIGNLRPESRMTLEQAKHFTLVYGQCPRCARTLKAAESVERGIGPVCVKYFGGFGRTVAA